MLTYARQERAREEAEVAFVRSEFDSKSLKLRLRQARSYSSYAPARMPKYAHVYSRMLTYAHVCSRTLTYADVCSRMLTYAHVCSHMLMHAHVCSRMLTYGDVCSRMLTYAHVCSRMQAELQRTRWECKILEDDRITSAKLVEQVLSRMLMYAVVC
jgi:hypothetical protein